MKNVAIKVIDRLFVVVYGAADPTDEEWRAYLELVERHGIERTIHLVFTEGGRPSSAQTRLLNELLHGHNVPVAVVSGSPRVRATVAALSWFNRRIKTFSPAALAEAFAYLGIPASRTELIVREAERLRTEIGVGRRASA